MKICALHIMCVSVLYLYVKWYDYMNAHIYDDMSTCQHEDYMCLSVMFVFKCYVYMNV